MSHVRRIFTIKYFNKYIAGSKENLNSLDLRAFPQDNCEISTEEKIQNVFCFVRDLKAKAFSNTSVPECSKLFVHCFLNCLSGELVVLSVLLASGRYHFDSLSFHFLLHVGMLKRKEFLERRFIACLFSGGMDTSRNKSSLCSIFVYDFYESIKASNDKNVFKKRRRHRKLMNCYLIRQMFALVKLSHTSFVLLET